MSWFQRLYEAYQSAEIASKDSDYEVAPVAHKHQDINIEIQLNDNAEIETAKILFPEKNTIIPIIGINNASNWGLAVKIKSYLDKSNGYQKQLDIFASHSNNDKVSIINQYIKKDTLIKDLLDNNIIQKKGDKEEYEIYQEPDSKKKIKYSEPFIRWVVGFDKNRQTWNNKSIVDAWKQFAKDKNNNLNPNSELCYITGNKIPLTQSHPPANGKNKIISSYDDKNFVFEGRFRKAQEVVGVGYDITWKAHNVLHWLMAEERGQAYLNGEQKFVAWTSRLSNLPKIGEGSGELLEENISGDVGLHFGKALKEKIKGYNVKLEPNENTMVLGIDNANPGRTSVIYYRELLGSKFLENVETWHNKYSWEQYLYSRKEDKYQYFIGAPSLDTIANFYLYKKDKFKLEQSQYKIKKRIIKDLIPTVIEGLDIPKYIEQQYIRRASNPVALSDTQWKTILRIACAIYKGNKYKEEDEMCLDETSTDRNYLYGRLLAILDDTEQGILLKQKAERLTNAKRFMNKFSITPAVTWKQLYEKFMQAYRPKLKGNWIENSVQEIISLKPNAFKMENNSPLNGDYLLGYFCQLKKNAEGRKKRAEEKQTVSEK